MSENYENLLPDACCKEYCNFIFYAISGWENEFEVEMVLRVINQT